MFNPQVVELLGKDSEGRPYWNGYGLARTGVHLSVGFEVSQAWTRPISVFACCPADLDMKFSATALVPHLSSHHYGHGLAF